MKKLFFTFIVLLICCNTYAQPPQNGTRHRGDRPSGPPPRGQFQDKEKEGEVWIENMPQIPNITLEQREKLGSIIKKEHNDIEKELKKKQKIQMTFEKETSLSQKEIDKKLKEMDKLDEKIQKIKDKSNNKIKKVLTDEEQYTAFIKQRSEIKFRKHDRMRREPREDDRPERPNFQEAPTEMNTDFD